jgi:hypothetical protein
MKIVVLGLVSDDVGKELGQIQRLFGDAIDSTVADVPFDTKIEMLFFSPIITRPGIGPFPDKISYLRREPAINAAINVSHEAWARGDVRDRMNLVADALLGVIDSVKETKLDPRTKLKLRETIERARHMALGRVLA